MYEFQTYWLLVVSDGLLVVFCLIWFLCVIWLHLYVLSRLEAIGGHGYWWRSRKRSVGFRCRVFICSNWLLYKLQNAHTKTINYIKAIFSALFFSALYAFISISFLWGVSFYGGYITFLNTPYSPIFELSDNELKDVLISTSGLLSVFSILSSMSGSAGRFKKQ